MSHAEGQNLAISEIDLTSAAKEDESILILAEQTVDLGEMQASAKIIFYKDKRFQVGTISSEGELSGHIEVNYAFPSLDTAPVQLAVEVVNLKTDEQQFTCTLSVDDTVVFKGVAYNGTSPNEIGVTKFYSWEDEAGNIYQTIFLPSDLDRIGLRIDTVKD